MKFLNVATFIRYVLAKLSKFVQISAHILLTEDSATSFQATFFIKFFDKKFSFLILLLPDFDYFPSYSVKDVPCFKLRHLMTS